MTTPSSTRVPFSQPQVGATTLLGVSTSLKPAPGLEGRSAARSLLCYALNAVQAVYPNVSLLDLRDHPPPLFDGRMPHDRNEPSLNFLWSCVHGAGALLVSVPAYWSGVSGVFKNFVDTLCGPAYDMLDATATVFASKPVGLLIVGSDDVSAEEGTNQAKQIMRSTGAYLVGEPVVVSNPRSSDMPPDLLARDLIVLAAELARHAYAPPK